MPIPPAVLQLLTFLQIPSDWVQHLIDENYDCGCRGPQSIDFTVRVDRTYCEKWQSKTDLDRARQDVQRAQKRYDDARNLTAKA